MADSFSDLPDALVRDLLDKALPVGEIVKNRVDAMTEAREHLRGSAKKLDLIRKKSELDVVREPSVVGIDGSYQIHRLTAIDLCAVAAVAVEGTTKEARRHWQEPFHRMLIEALPHSAASVNPLRAMMVFYELDLASQSPHDLVLLDGSFSSLIIYINQGLQVLGEISGALQKEIAKLWGEVHMFESLLGLLQSNRTVAVPKYTSRNELKEKLDVRAYPVIDDIDGKTLATLILEADEYTKPMEVYGNADERDFHVATLDANDSDRLNSAMRDISVVYYRPYEWIPAMRLEVPSSLSRNPHRLSMLLEGIARQLFSPAVHEPYPLFLADRMVKSLGSGVSVVEQSVAQHVVGSSQNAEKALLYLQNYRTEQGRGGVS